jgi:hypothetical protein
MFGICSGTCGAAAGGGTASCRLDRDDRGGIVCVASPSNPRLRSSRLNAVIVGNGAEASSAHDFELRIATVRIRSGSSSRVIVFNARV